MNYICLYENCNFSTSKEKILEKHNNTKHKKLKLKNIKEEEDENIDHEAYNIVTNNTDNTDKKYKCEKCEKKYKIYKSYDTHVKNCKGINILTCPKCMKVFTCKQHKNRHIKTNTCKPKSLLNNNYFAINNYKNERIDYITDDMFFDIISNNMLSIKKYIEYKHFNKDFQENNNIIYDNRLKKCFIKINNEWISKNIDSIVNMLISDNSYEMINRYEKDKDNYNNKIQNIDKIEHLRIYLYYTIFETINKKMYNMMKKDIKDSIRNSIGSILTAK